MIEICAPATMLYAQPAARGGGHDRRQRARRRHERESHGAASLTDRHASKLWQVADAPGGYIVPAGLELVEAKRAIGTRQCPRLLRRDVDVHAVDRHAARVGHDAAQNPRAE
jgi:hypothetical protein